MALPQRFRWLLILRGSTPRTSSTRTKKFILAGILIACLGVLFTFKYFNFFMDSLSELASLLALKMHPITLKLMLPVGISFYTFQTLGYVIDVYRGTTKAERHFGIYAAFISFFPQLVAGPIERTNNLLPQIKAHHTFNYEQAVYGAKLMAWGFFKKLAVADVLAVYVDRVFGNVYSYKGFTLVLATFFFAVQIYCDFSGYSDIARGCSKLFGIDLMKNFKSPYFASSIREFWSRWHISLSTWFRDYLYIPLGGNRRGKFRRYMNIMITFLVSGLWHGASWTFVIWGGVHGLAQVFEDVFGLNRKRNALRVAGVFMFTCLAWVFFRAGTLSEALYVFSHMFTGISDLREYIHLHPSMGIGHSRFAFIILLVAILAAYDFASLKHNVIDSVSRLKLIPRWVVYNLLTAGIFWVYSSLAVSNASFIYFQF